ncbi:hypothetical protein PVNG_02168 [Plasmodium vivax North Korean]|uniref:Variable surface protein n=1 Tax=Plasmodium vivax North Korean TaxID=1035514 RepID=A0A0J9TTL8_PLAVI|nr:hypothetical protein PVNG_02168 [Plasmodium vivax North Korean]
MDMFFFRNYYPFLKRIWENYGYDEDVDESTTDVNIISLCNENTIYKNNLSGDRKNACKKLLRNFMLLRNNEINLADFDDWCKNFNNWIYYEINPYNLTDDTVYNILLEAQKKLTNLPYKQYCSYKSVNENEHLQELIGLRIFNDNTPTFLSILKKESDQDYCYCQKFIEDCVNIYRYMIQHSCSNQGTRSQTKEICKVISQFPIYYTYLTNDSAIVKKIPNIHNGIREEKLLNCPSTDKTLEVPSSLDTGSDTTVPKRDSTVPTALGTVAGASSVLALLYKVNRIIHLNICTTKYIDYYLKLYKKFSL